MLIIDVGIEHEIVDTSIVASSKPFEFSRADRGYMVAPNFFSSS